MTFPPTRLCRVRAARTPPSGIFPTLQFTPTTNKSQRDTDSAGAKANPIAAIHHLGELSLKDASSRHQQKPRRFLRLRRAAHRWSRFHRRRAKKTSASPTPSQRSSTDYPRARPTTDYPISPQVCFFERHRVTKSALAPVNLWNRRSWSASVSAGSVESVLALARGAGRERRS